jgi:hypothetical protein
MRLNKYLNNVECKVINLTCRPDKKKYIEQHLKSRNIIYSFFMAEKNIENPKRGCLESHLSIIKEAIELPDNNKKYLMILEDDCKFIGGFSQMSEPPSDWDMIYLGGTVHRVLDRSYKGYARVQCWTTHAYIINLTNRDLCNKIVNDLETYEGEIDRYYLEKIHPNFNVYMCDPMIAIQKEGYSDIECREVSYDFMQNTLKGLRSPEYTIDADGNYVLKLIDIGMTDLPKVSIITPTYKRRKIFDMAIRNFQNFIYPREKLEWIIVEDTPISDENDTDSELEDLSIKDLLPRDKRIKYISMPLKEEDEPMTIAMKRNIAVANSTAEYIIHMDDDDYYPPESILARIKILLKYKNEGIECVGSTLIGTYNILSNHSSMSSDGPISLSEASMAYTRKFWEERSFDDACIRGEHKAFTEQRLDKIIDIPYSFILIAVNHKTNFTDSLRSDNTSELKYSKESGKEGTVANFFDTWDDETQIFIMDLRRYLQDR